MLHLDSEKWKSLDGGYRDLYDVSIALKLLESSRQPDAKIWNELWGNLYHQGDVGIASYAAVPQILRIYQEKNWLDFHLPSFAGAVEEARTRKQNSEVPDWLQEDYFNALQRIAQYCLANSKRLDDRNFSRSLLMLVAILLREKTVYELLDCVSISDEEKLLKIYNESK